MILMFGCASPWREKGFASDQDYELSIAAGGIGPQDVEQFKRIRIRTKEEYKNAENEMLASGYSSLQREQEVYAFVVDKFWGSVNGKSASEQRAWRQEEERKDKLRKEETARDKAKKEKEQAQEANRQKQIQIDREAKSQKALAAELERLDRVGPNYCAKIRDISRTVREKVASALGTDPLSVRLNRVYYISSSQYNTESLGEILGKALSRELYDGSPMTPSCRVILYTAAGPVYCDIVEQSHLNAGFAVGYKYCERVS